MTKQIQWRDTFTSDIVVPFITLNAAYKELAEANKMKSGSIRSYAMTRLNKARASWKRKLDEKAGVVRTKRENPGAYAVIKNGLRVGISYDMDEDGLIEARILNEQGYRFHIDHTLSSEDWWAVHDACYAAEQEEKDQARIAHYINEVY